jgi:hypothetical protein
VDNVWHGAIRRYVSKANSLSYKANLLATQAEARRTKADLEYLEKPLDPLGHIDASGSIVWRADFLSHVCASE